MLRSITVSVFACLLMCPLLVQAEQDKGSASQESTEKDQAQSPGENGQSPTEKPAAPEPVKSEYPLDTFTNFSALVSGSFLMDDPTEVHIYRSGNFMRVEGSGGVGYYLTDMKGQSTYHVWDDGCTLDKHVYLRTAPWAAAARPGYKVQVVSAGKESLDGHSCRIEDVTITGPDLKRPLKLRLWEADDLQGFPIRIDSVRLNGHNRTIRYKNVVLGPQDKTLFIHPKSCDPALGSGKKTVMATPKISKKPISAPPDPQQ
jgi:hypothetical protein